MGLLNWLHRRRARAAAPPVVVESPGALEPVLPESDVGGFVVVDIETTGLLPARDRIVEIAAVRTDCAGRIIDEWTTLINPSGAVGATRIHGILPADVRRAPRFADIAGGLTARMAGRALVAHNARFDLSFLEIEYARAGWELPRAAPYLCTLEASSFYLPHLPRRRLYDCCWACGIELQDAHSALGDARATAQLLAFYLDPRLRPPPSAEHLALPALAVRVPWPPVPVRNVPVEPRVSHHEPEVSAPPGALWELLDDLPLSSVIEEGAPLNATAYLELLSEVLEDGVLTASEAKSLAEVAKVYSMSRDQVEAAHRAFLLALAHKIVEDGKVTRDERALLQGAASALGYDDGLPRKILDAARAALHEGHGERCKPLPPDWAYGEPLRVGQAVAFTGCDQLVRARLEGHAQAVGLRVTGSVSRKTAVLVTDGANPRTTKALAAHELGTRVFSPEVFAVLVEYVQPAVPAAPTSPAPAQRVPDESVVADSGPLADPAEVRAWARQRGLAVGVRGRIPSNVLAAYRAEHDLAPR